MTGCQSSSPEFRLRSIPVFIHRQESGSVIDMGGKIDCYLDCSRSSLRTPYTY